MDDEGERKTKLQAGKEALLAYQKKKAKKTKKKSNECDESSDNSRSEPSSDFSAIAGRVQSESNVSPIPWSESSASGETSATSVTLPLGFSPDVSSVGVVPVIDHVALESSVVIGIADKDIDKLLNKERELESFDAAVPLQSNEGAHNGSQILALHKCLVDSEMERKELQMQLAELSLKHKTEIESAINQERRIQEQVLQEHVSHIARLSTELANSQLHEPDEGEAMRIKLIKEQLKSMYEQEKSSLLVEHKREKDQLSKDYLQQQENFQKKVEQQANGEIQKIHSEYRTAYEQVLAEKIAFESEANNLKVQCSAVEKHLEEALHLKESIEEKHQLLMQTHSDEIQGFQQAAHEAEESILFWKKKTTALEAKVSGLETEQQELCHQIDQLKRVQLDTQEELFVSKALAQQSQLEVAELKSEHKLYLQHLEEQHLAEKEELQGKLTSQLTSLEDSLSEASGDKASLDVAEVHMKNLEKQLREYRLQEQSFQNKLDQLEQQHNEHLEAIRHQFEAEKAEEIENVTAEFAKQIEVLEEELSHVQTLVQSQHPNSNHDLDLLKVDHDRALLELQHKCEESQRTVCQELQLAHDKELEAVKLQHKSEIAAIKTKTQADIEALRQELRKRHFEEKESEIQSLKQKHSATIQQLRESLLESEDSPLAVSEARVAELKEELREQRDELQATNQDIMSQLEFAQRNLEESKHNILAANQDKKHLSEQLMQFEEAVRTLKVDLSIAMNSADEARSSLQLTTQQLEHCKQKLDVMNSTCESKEQKINQLSKELADKQNVITDLAAQCEALKKEVLQISQQEHKVSLQLELVKGECVKHHSDYDAAVLMLSTRDAELLQIRTELSASHHQLATSQQLHEAAVSALLKEIEGLKLKASEDQDRIHRLSSSVADLQRNLDVVHTENCSLNALHGGVRDDEEELELVCKERDLLLLKIEQLEKSQAVFEDEQNKSELKILEQGQQIQDLLLQLNAREVAYSELQNKLSRKRADVDDSGENGLGKQPLGLSDRFIGLAGEKGCIEESLSTAREALTMKLKEKADLERNLNFHRTELERRLAEKQRLEELLFEKSRFEQELQSQKDQLQSELRDIELRLRLKEKELDQRHLEWKSSIEVKDGIIQKKEEEIAMKVTQYEKEVQQKQQCINELDHLHDQLVHKHSVELKQLTQELASHHSQDLETLELHLSQRHQESMLSLEEKHKKELEYVKEQLLVTHRQELEVVCQQLDGRRRKEVSTVKMVLEQEKQSDMMSLFQKLNSQYNQSMHDVVDKLQSQYRKMCHEVFAIERARLESEYALCLDCFKVSVAYENGQQFCVQLEQLCTHYREELESLRKKYETFDQYKMSQGPSKSPHLLNQRQSIENDQQIAAILGRHIDANTSCPEPSLQLDDTCTLQRNLMPEHFAETGQLRKTHSEDLYNLSAYICEDPLEGTPLPAMMPEFGMSVLSAEYQQSLETLGSSLSSDYEREQDYDVSYDRVLLEKKIRHLKSQLQKMSYNMRHLNISHQQSIAQLKADCEQQRMLTVSECELKLAAFCMELESLRWALEQQQQQQPKLDKSYCCQEVQTIPEIENDISLQNHQSLKEAHEQKCLELQAKFAEDIEMLKIAHSKDLSKTVTAANEEAANMLKQQKDRLLKMHNLNLWVLESKMHSEFSQQLEYMKAEMEERYVEALSALYVKSAIRTASILEIAESKRNEGKQTTREELQIAFNQKCFEVEDVTEQLKEEYESKLLQLKKTITEEYTSQITQLKIDHKVYLAEQEHTLCMQLEADHSKQLKEIADNYTTKKEFEIEQACIQLSQQHMVKFREMTEKLQEVHQAELTAANQDNDLLQTQHEEAISIIREELECKHQVDIAHLIASHRDELLSVKELLQKKAEENSVLASNFKELESELSTLKQQHSEMLLASEAQSQVQKSVEERLDAKQNELIELEDVTKKEVAQIEQIMSEKFQEMEHNLQLKIAENDYLHQTQRSLQGEKLQLQSAFHQLTKETELLQQSSNHLAEKLRETEIQLSECQVHLTRQLKEDQNTVMLLQHELEVVKAERAVLATQLTSVHSVVVDSLQLIATLSHSLSSIPNTSKQPCLQRTTSTMELEHQSECLTPEHFPAPSSKFDSGFASQHPSTLPSHLSIHDESESCPLHISDDNHQLSGEVFHAQPAPGVQKDDCAGAGHDLTIIPLEDTLCTSQYDLGPETHMLELSLQHKAESDAHNNLSVYPIDQTHEQSILSQQFGVAAPSDIQGDLFKLHCSIRDLIEGYIVAASEAFQCHVKLQQLEDKAAGDNHAFTVQVSELSGKVQQKDSDLRDKQEQLAAAEAKIHELVDQVENGGSDLIDGVEDLLGAFKSNERTLGDLKKQLEEANELLHKKETDLQQLAEELSAMKDDAIKQIQAYEMEKQEWQKINVSSGQELEHARNSCMSVQLECAALREANTELRVVKERLELSVHTQEGQMNQLINDHTQQLKNKSQEISYFKDLPNQLAAKEEIIENLVAEKESLVNKLYSVEHELALHKSNMQKEACLSDREVSLSTALEQQTQASQELKKELNCLQCKLAETEQACLDANSSESKARQKLVAVGDGYLKALQGLQERSSLLSHQLEMLKSESKTKFQEFTQLLQLIECEVLKLIDKQHATLTSQFEGLQEKNMALLHTIAEKDCALEHLNTTKTHLDSKLAKIVEEKLDVDKKCQLHVALLEEQLASVRHELAQQFAHSKLLQNDHDRLRGEISSLDAERRKEIENLKVLHQQALAVQDQAHTEELASVRIQHHTVVQNMTTEHDQHISQLNLEHAEDLERQRSELTSQHAGEVAFLKMHSHKTSPNSAEQNGQHTSIQGSIQGSIQDVEDDGGDLSDETLLSKIMELGPLLEAEAEAVRELCCLTGQQWPVQDDAAPSGSIQSVIEQLQAMLHDLQNKMTASDIEDWRKELIGTVEKILQHEHSKLATQGTEEPHSAEHKGDEDLVAKYQRVFQEQMSSYSAQVQQLHSAERDSLIAEMRELQRVFDLMRSEQKEQITNLQSQLTQVKESSKLENQELLHQLNEVNSAHMHQLEEILQLRASLESEGVKSAQLQLRLNQAEIEHRELEAERARLESSVQSLQEEVLDSRRNFNELEELASRAATTISALEHELKASCSKEAALRRAVAELRTRQAMPGYETQDNPECAQPVEKPASESMCKIEDLQQRLGIVQRDLLAAREDVSESQQVLSVRQQEMERLHANIVAQEVDHKMKMEQFSQLFDKEHKANGALKDALQTKDAELQSLKLECAELQRRHIPMEKAGSKKVQADCSGWNSVQGVEEKFCQLYMHYHQAELRRRSLLFQKKYLQCQLDAFYQTQQASLMMLADMGAPVDTQLSKINPLSTPSNRFRIAVIAVTSIVRIRLLQRKKGKYVRSKLEELRLKFASPTAVSPAVTIGSSVASHSEHELEGPHTTQFSPARKKHQVKVQKKTKH